MTDEEMNCLLNPELLDKLNDSSKNKPKIKVKSLPLPKRITHPVLPATYRSYAVVMHIDLEDLARKVYNLKNYDFRHIQPYSNHGTVHEFEVQPKVLDSDKVDLDNMKETGYLSEYLGNDALLDCLCFDGYIQAGRYLITVD